MEGKLDEEQMIKVFSPNEFEISYAPLFNSLVARFQSISAFMILDTPYVLGVKTDEKKMRDQNFTESRMSCMI